MTIKEIEETLGMTRANIRFYEQEGLLSPARNPNGYRDYSPEDVETLKKIKLLRGLHLDLETIRALQRGEQSLSAALEQQRRQLEADQAALTGARAVCVQLWETAPEYATLDAGPWLKRLEEAPVSERFSPPKDEKPMPAAPFRHPWRRYFARSMDVSLYGLVILAVLLLGFHAPVEIMTSRVMGLLLGWLANLPMLLLEPFMLSRWGTTPGKAIFGIKVLDPEGEKMSLLQARRRTMEVFAKGMGYGIPFYEIYRNYKSLRGCESWEWHDWEVCSCAGEPEQMTVSGEDWRCGAYVAVRAGVYALAVLIALQSLMPPCRGELDLAGFCRNVNFYQHLLSLDGTDFTPEGVREERAPEPGVVVIDLYENEYREAWSPIEDGGATVGFRYTLQAQGMFLDGNPVSQQLGLLAYVGSLPRTNCVSFFRDGWLSLLGDRPWEFDLTHKGVRLTQSAEIQGAEKEGQTGSWLFAGVGDDPVTLKLEFTVSEAGYQLPQ